MENNCCIAKKYWQISATLALLVIPIADAILKIPLNEKRALNLTAFDITIFPAFFLLLWSWMTSGELRQKISDFGKKFSPSLIFLCIVIIGFILNYGKIVSISLSIKSFIQYLEYLFIAPVVFSVLFATNHIRAWRTFTFGSLISMIICGLDYWFSKNETLFSVGGLLLNKNNFAVYFVLSLPILSIVLFNDKSKIIKAVASITFLLGIYLSFTAWAVVAISITLALFILKGINDHNYSMFLINSLFVLMLFFSVYRHRTPIFDSVQVYAKYIDSNTGETTVRHTMRYYRWAANMNMIKANLFLGVGVGQYGKHIKKYYYGINLPEGRTDIEKDFDIKTNEPFSFGLFFIILSEMGIIGSFAFVFVLINLVYSAFSTSNKGEVSVTLKMVLLLAVIANCFLILFANPLTRGCGGVISILIAFGFLVSEKSFTQKLR